MSCVLKVVKKKKKRNKREQLHKHIIRETCNIHRCAAVISGALKGLPDDDRKARAGLGGRGGALGTAPRAIGSRLLRFPPCSPTALKLTCL